MKLKGRVELTESLGVEVILNVGINGEKIVAKLDRRSKARAGDEIDLYFDMNQLHIFDRETGERIEF
jgi:multiple sugar transport system ATP-binding protein